MTDDFQRTLTMDPLLEAEKLTGKSYKEDAITEAIGFAFLQSKAAYVKDQMMIRNDTYRGCPFEYAIRILDDLGFKVLYEETFVAGAEYDDARNETFLMLWRDGILATADSITWTLPGRVPELNSIDLYANWLPNDPKSRTSYTETGHSSRRTPGFDGDLPDDPWTWIGHWSALEGVRNTIDRLEGAGRFLNPWLEQPMLHLNNYGHKSTLSAGGSDWKEKWVAERDSRIALLPQNVQDAIRGEKVNA